jgi:hypothetical protein
MVNLLKQQVSTFDVHTAKKGETLLCFKFNVKTIASLLFVGTIFGLFVSFSFLVALLFFVFYQVLG